MHNLHASSTTSTIKLYQPEITSLPTLRANGAFIIRTDGNAANVARDGNNDNNCEENVKTKGVIHVVGCMLHLQAISRRADESTHLQ